MSKIMYGLMNKNGEMMGVSIDIITHENFGDCRDCDAKLKYELRKSSNIMWLTNDIETAKKVLSIGLYNAANLPDELFDDYQCSGETYDNPINYYRDLKVVEVDILIKEV